MRTARWLLAAAASTLVAQAALAQTALAQTAATTQTTGAQTTRSTTTSQSTTAPASTASMTAPPMAAASNTTTSTTATTTTGAPAFAPISPAGNIVATLKASGQFTLLLKAVDATGLTPVLSSPGPLTVFAPTDAAFAALMPADQLDAALKDQAKVGQIQALLTYHVINAKLPPIKGHAQTSIQTVAAGKKVTVDGLADPVTVNDAKVLQGEIATTNGVIYVIDKVLSPDFVPPPPTAAPATDATTTATDATTTTTKSTAKAKKKK